jgi:predicted ester cyclase
MVCERGSTPQNRPSSARETRTLCVRAAFPDFRATILDEVCGGDEVITSKVFHGTHRGEFHGLEPTGREVEIAVIDIVRVADRRIVEHWTCVDRLGLLAQLGALPQDAAATG